MKRADILLVYPPYHKVSFVSSIPHLSAYAKKLGFSVDTLDTPTLGLDVHDIVDYVGFSKPRSVGVSIPFTPLATQGKELLRKLAKFYPDLPLIVGGVHPTLCPEEFTDYAFVCVGDGENALVNFLHWVQGNYPMPNRILKIPTDIKKVEPPDWEAVEWRRYSLRLPTGERGFPIQGSLGCPFNCLFCSSNLLFRGKVRFKTVEQVGREICEGIEQFGLKTVIFRDENITLNKQRFFELCRYLKENKITWWAQTRAHLLNDELARIANDSGCRGISIGVETGDPYVMKMIQKGETLEQIEEGFKILKRAGLRSAANFMIGHPWDTPETVQRTLEFADKIDPDYFGVQIATPFPGTKFRETAWEQGIELSKNWGEYHTSKVTYVPPGLAGLDLVKMRAKIYWDWYMLKPSRFFTVLLDKGSLRHKLRYLRSLFKLWRDAK